MKIKLKRKINSKWNKEKVEGRWSEESSSFEWDDEGDSLESVQLFVSKKRKKKVNEMKWKKEKKNTREYLELNMIVIIEMNLNQMIGWKKKKWKKKVKKRK